MGYSVRSHEFRYTTWFPATQNEDDPTKPALITNWMATETSHPPRFSELYDHRGDDGTDFDWAGNNENVASKSENAPAIAQLHQKVLHFFREQLPCAPPIPGAGPLPPAPAKCVDGWQQYNNSFCGDKGKNASIRYSYIGNESTAQCKAKCKDLGPSGCKCMDVGRSKNLHEHKCRLERHMHGIAKSGQGFTAFVPC